MKSLTHFSVVFYHYLLTLFRVKSNISHFVKIHFSNQLDSSTNPWIVFSKNNRIEGKSFNVLNVLDNLIAKSKLLFEKKADIPFESVEFPTIIYDNIHISVDFGVFKSHGLTQISRADMKTHPFFQKVLERYHWHKFQFYVDETEKYLYVIRVESMLDCKLVQVFYSPNDDLCINLVPFDYHIIPIAIVYTDKQWAIIAESEFGVSLSLPFYEDTDGDGENIREDIVDCIFNYNHSEIEACVKRYLLQKGTLPNTHLEGSTKIEKYQGKFYFVYTNEQNVEHSIPINLYDIVNTHNDNLKRDRKAAK